MFLKVTSFSYFSDLAYVVKEKVEYQLARGAKIFRQKNLYL